MDMFTILGKKNNFNIFNDFHIKYDIIQGGYE